MPVADNLFGQAVKRTKVFPVFGNIQKLFDYIISLKKV